MKYRILITKFRLQYFVGKLILLSHFIAINGTISVIDHFPFAAGFNCQKHTALAQPTLSKRNTPRGVRAVRFDYRHQYFG